jgi:hypothetical protein
VKFVVALALIGAGYTIFYYGIVMFQMYDVKTTKTTDAIPLSVLFGFTSDAKTRKEKQDMSPQPPFRK